MVSNRYNKIFVFLLDRDVDLCIYRRIFGCIFDKVVEYLLNPDFINLNIRQSFTDIQRQSMFGEGAYLYMYEITDE